MTIVSTIADFFQHNQLITGGLLVGAGSFLKSLPEQVAGWARRQFMVTLHINNSEPAFDWVNVWMDKQPYARRSRLLSVTTEVGRKKDSSNNLVSGKHPTLFFTAAPGFHIFTYKRRLITLSRVQDKEQTMTGWMQTKPRETFVMRVLGRNQSVIRDLMREAMDTALGEEANGVPILTSQWANWKKLGDKPKRGLDSVILPDGTMESLIKDMQHFRNHREWYAQTGIPYRRGYLLYGAPGTGKSSTVLALASHFDVSVYILSLNSSEIDDESIVTMLSLVPEGNIVLIEDVDVVFTKRKDDEKKQSKVTFSGLLNAIDGVVATEGRLLFMTTNHIERLDPALIRPGRIDKRVLLDVARQEQVYHYIRHLLPDAGEEFAQMFAGMIGDNRVSMAAVQGHLLEHWESPQDALASIPSLLAALEAQKTQTTEKVENEQPD